MPDSTPDKNKDLSFLSRLALKLAPKAQLAMRTPSNDNSNKPSDLDKYVETLFSEEKVNIILKRMQTPIHNNYC